MAWNLRKWRTARGLTQDALAHEAAFSRTFIGELERGEKNVTLDAVDRLAAALAVTADELLRRPATGEEKPSQMKPGRKAKL